MLSPLPAVSCGCICTVIVLWLHRSPGLCVLLLRLWVSAPWLAGVPHLAPSTCHQSTLCSPATLGKCHLLLPWAVLQLSECVSLHLKGNRLTILYQNQHFGLFFPLGEKNPFPIAAGAISSPQARQRAVSVELEVLKSTGVCWPLQTQHISLVPLSVTVFLGKGSGFQLKPEVSRAGGSQGTACNRTETRKPA